MAVSTLVRVTRAYACSAERVYDAWLEPATARRFLFTTPLHGEVVRCEIEPGIGGRFTVVDRRSLNDGEGWLDVVHTGRFLQLDRPRRIAFAFAVPTWSPAETTVIIDITPQGDGCDLVLRHDLGPEVDGDATVERAEQGWTQMLLALERALQDA
ncbi:SRPBCC family protein [Ramlibacter tataouinensis]|uniref:Activator of Hsp90 ATPase homologue 1/2-like C-terminal domain-containing protein n=1 Tax=Ramlibacter tataouinensis (strain ATCC BAA-407 / DSM 14655 / LMG 21543 / TTB310) TaxID=365046 RepID=F5Y2B9_RAMTT|nr:SRPBCC family protein [Ramlibacter tataouinensis]AEG91093.1 Hypothetical protein Rta_00330 [Ramlibacter tataouinensis TTB310]